MTRAKESKSGNQRDAPCVSVSEAFVRRWQFGLLVVALAGLEACSGGSPHVRRPWRPMAKDDRLPDPIPPHRPALPSKGLAQHPVIRHHLADTRSPQRGRISDHAYVPTPDSSWNVRYKPRSVDLRYILLSVYDNAWRNAASRSRGLGGLASSMAAGVGSKVSTPV